MNNTKPQSRSFALQTILLNPCEFFNGRFFLKRQCIEIEIRISIVAEFYLHVLTKIFKLK